MNKKGFTLVELLAVIALVAVLSGLAVTNIISSINNSRKNQFLLDGKRLVSKAEYLMSQKREYRSIAKETGLKFFFNSYSYDYNDKTIIIDGLNEKDEFNMDPDGGTYSENINNQEGSYVYVTLSDNKYNYCIYLQGLKRSIGTDQNCISSDLLSGIDVINDI